MLAGGVVREMCLLSFPDSRQAWFPVSDVDWPYLEIGAEGASG